MIVVCPRVTVLLPLPTALYQITISLTQLATDAFVCGQMNTEYVEFTLFQETKEDPAEFHIATLSAQVVFFDIADGHIATFVCPVVFNWSELSHIATLDPPEPPTAE